MSMPGTPQRVSVVSTPLATAVPPTPDALPVVRIDYQVFDIIAPLHEILCRLVAAGPDTSTPASGAPESTSACFPGQQPLDVQQLEHEISSVKARIRRARAVVDMIPDGERTVEEQRKEMEWLAKKIAEQRKVLAAMIND